MTFAGKPLVTSCLLAAMLVALAGCDRIAAENDGDRGAEPVPVLPAVVESAEVKPFAGGLKVEGLATVLNADTLLQLDGDIKAAEIEVEFSMGQLERFRQTTALAIQTVAAAERQEQADKARLQLLNRRLTQTWGADAPFVSQSTREELMPRLSTGAQALVRLDFPAATPAPPRNVRVISLHGGSERTIGALWEAPSGSDTLPGATYFGLVETAPGLRPGDRARLVAERPEEQAGTIVPNAAIVIYEGQAWCYVVKGDDEFERQRVPLEHPAENGYLVQSGFPEGTRVVVRGASVLLAREAEPGGLDDDDGGDAAVRPRAKPSQDQPAAGGDDDPPPSGAASSSEKAGKSATDATGGGRKSDDVNDDDEGDGPARDHAAGGELSKTAKSRPPAAPDLD